MDLTASQHTPRSIAGHVGGRVVGSADLPITGLAEIGSAQPGRLTFIGDAAWAARWARSKASAAIVSENIDLEPGEGRALIYVPSADLAMAKVLEQFAPPPVRPITQTPSPAKSAPQVSPPGTTGDALAGDSLDATVHPTAIVAEGAALGKGVTVGPYCVIHQGVTVGDGTVLHAHVCLLDDVRVGRRCVLWPNVVVRERCVIGDRCVLEPGVVLGADGFGYRPDTSGKVPRIVKIPHLGNVVLGDEVEVGANTTIDRGKFEATTIGSGTKIDNQVQIGHNCRIGQMVIISGCTAVGGSVVIGDGALIGGAVIFKDHVTVGSRGRIAGAAGVIHDVPDDAEWAGYPAQNAKDTFRQIAALRKLPDLLKQLKRSR